jgi:hypothetical protein
MLANGPVNRGMLDLDRLARLIALRCPCVGVDFIMVSTRGDIVGRVSLSGSINMGLTVPGGVREDGVRDQASSPAYARRPTLSPRCT